MGYLDHYYTVLVRELEMVRNSNEYIWGFPWAIERYQNIHKRIREVAKEKLLFEERVKGVKDGNL